MKPIAAAISEPETSPRTIRKSPAGQMPERLAREDRGVEAARRRLDVVELLHEVRRRTDRDCGDRNQQEGDDRGDRAMSRDRGAHLPPGHRVASADRLEPEPERNRDHEPREARNRIGEKRGGGEQRADPEHGAPRRASVPPRALQHDREGEHEERHRRFLESALGEERGAEVRKAAEDRGREARREGEVAKRRKGSERGQRGDREQEAVEGRDQVDAGDRAKGRGQCLRADRIAELHCARFGAKAALEPISPVELGGVVVGVDALAEHADVPGERERDARQQHGADCDARADQPRGAGRPLTQAPQVRGRRNDGEADHDRRRRVPAGKADQKRRQRDEGGETSRAGEPTAVRPPERAHNCAADREGGDDQNQRAGVDLEHFGGSGGYGAGRPRSLPQSTYFEGVTPRAGKPLRVRAGWRAAPRSPSRR